MRISTLLSTHRPNPSAGCGVALALTATVSALGMAWVQPAWAKISPLLAASGESLLAQADAPAPNSVLLPGTEDGTEGNGVMMQQRQTRLRGLYGGPVDGQYAAAAPQEAIAEAQSDPAAELDADLDADPTTEPTEPTEPTSAVSMRPDRSLVWLTLGGLALVGSLGGWLWLGQGKKRSQSDKLPETPPHQDLAPSADVADQGFPSTSHPQSAAAAETDLPLEATTRLSPVDIVDSLVQELASPDRAVRRHAIWELGQRGHSDVIQPLVDGLLEADSQEKSLIFAALAEISSRSLRPMHRALTLGLQDPSPEVRKNAIRDLSRVYDTVVQLSPMLAHAAQDPDPGVQETAQWALNQLNRIPAALYTEPRSPESTALESSHQGQQLTTESHHPLPPAKRNPSNENT